MEGSRNPPTPGPGHRRAATVMSADDVRRAIIRIAHEIVERNHGTRSRRAGRAAARRRVDRRRSSPTLARIDGIGSAVPVGSLDVSFYRDDVGLRPIVPGRVTDIPVALDGTTVILVDDVLFTGRTVRAALEALNEYGRPRAVQLAVIVDRGHRELPIRPDYVGKNLPTSRDEDVDVSADGCRDRVKHLLDIDDLTADDIHRLAGAHRPHGRDQPAPDPQGARRCAARPWSACSSRTRPAPARASTRRRKRLSADDDELRRVVEQRQQGREPARHDRDDRRDGRRRVRRPPRVQRRAAADHAMDQRQRHQRRRRLAPASDAGAARLLHDPHRPQPPRRASTDCASPSSATSSTAAWRAATCRRSPRSARTSRSSRRRRCCRRRSTGWPVDVTHDLDARDRRPRRRSTSCACNASGWTTRWCRSLREYIGDVRAHAGTCGALLAARAGDAPGPDEPRRRDGRRSGGAPRVGDPRTR